MPTYEYRCSNGHTFDVFQKMSDDPVTDCPECGANAQRVLSGGAGFLFKGEGFYITDYRSEDYKKKAAAEKGGGEKGGERGEKGEKGKKKETSGDAGTGSGSSSDSGTPAPKTSPSSKEPSGGSSSSEKG